MQIRSRYPPEKRTADSMTPEHFPDSHLTYCSNVHPGASWSDHFSELERALPPLKQRLSPDAPFGVGLRVSAIAAPELLSGDTLERFKEWLRQQGLYVFTLRSEEHTSELQSRDQL